MNVSDFRSYVTPHAPGVPVSVIDNLTRQVLIEFFTKTEAWVDTLDPIFVIPKLAFYDFTNPDGSKVISVKQDNYMGKDMRALDEMEIRPMLLKGVVGEPEYYSVTAASDLVIYPTVQNTGNQMFIKASLAPTGTFTSIPDHAVDEHIQAIVDGVLALLFTMPKGWNDPNAANAHRQMYLAAMSMAKNTNNKQRMNVVRKVRYGG